MAYATTAQMLDRYDNARLGDLVKDDGTRATSAQLLTDDVLEAMLDDASAMISSAARAGERYSAALLTSLALTDLLIVRLTCDLAYGLLLQRRGYPADQIANLAPGYIASLTMLTQLREGDRIFDDDAAANAGSAVDIDNWPNNNRGVYRLTKEAERYFGDLCKPNTPDCC